MKHEVTEKWYVPQVQIENGVWKDIADNDFTLKEARSEMCFVNCYGHKARIIERIAAFRVAAQKDFRAASKPC